MDKSELAAKILQWERVRKQQVDLETAIKKAVLQLGETVVVGNVKAVFRNGRKRYDYEEVGNTAPVALIEEHTTTIATTKINWRELVLEGMSIKRDAVPFTEAEPSVLMAIITCERHSEMSKEATDEYER